MIWPAELRASLVLSLGAVRAAAQPECRPLIRAPSLDHAIVVVRNLDSAWTRFQGIGFRYKPGRLHPDGLHNRHLKFRDHREIELVTVGEPA